MPSSRAAARAGSGARVAVKPVSVILRSVGRKAPMKLGCGQSASRLTTVSRAAGANSSVDEPENVRSTLKAKASGALSGAGRTRAPAPESRA